MAEQQAKLHAEAAAMTSHLQMQQRQLETQMLQEFQLRLQEQEKMTETLLQSQPMLQARCIHFHFFISGCMIVLF